MSKVPRELEIADLPLEESEQRVAREVRASFLVGESDEPYMTDIVRAFRTLRGMRHYVEVGTRDKGNLAWVARTFPTLMTMVDVDIEVYDEAEAKLRNVISKNIKYKRITGDSISPSTVRQVKESLGDVLADAIFCDSSHMYDHTLAEFEFYWNLLRPGGILLYHDVFWEGNDHDKGKSQAISAIDRFVPVWCVFMNDPIHRYLARSSKRDVWGGVGIIVKS